MKSGAIAVDVDADRARNWLRESLAGGHELSAAVLGSSRFDAGEFLVLLPTGGDLGPVPAFAEGGVVSSDLANAALAGILEDLMRQGAASVVVEDDVGRRGDPAIDKRKAPSAFMGDRVICWSELDWPGSGTVAVETIAEAASGYPRNAFVLSETAADLGVSAGRSLPADFAARAAASLTAVVVSAFDDESFLIWRA